MVTGSCNQSTWVPPGDPAAHSQVQVLPHDHAIGQLRMALCPSALELHHLQQQRHTRQQQQNTTVGRRLVMGGGSMLYSPRAPANGATPSITHCDGCLFRVGHTHQEDRSLGAGRTHTQNREYVRLLCSHGHWLSSSPCCCLGAGPHTHA